MNLFQEYLKFMGGMEKFRARQKFTEQWLYHLPMWMVPDGMPCLAPHDDGSVGFGTITTVDHSHSTTSGYSVRSYRRYYSNPRVNLGKKIDLMFEDMVAIPRASYNLIFDSEMDVDPGEAPDWMGSCDHSPCSCRLPDDDDGA